MAVDYTTAGMFTSIKLRGILPTSQTLYTEARAVAIMADELQSEIVPLLMKNKQEYLVHSYDQSIAVGQRSFFIPFRAVGMKLRDVVLVDSSGNEIKLDRYEPEDLKRGYAQSSPWGFYVDNDQVILLPTDADFSAYTFRAKIFRRPNRLVRSSDAGQITAINTGTKTVTCSLVPSSFTTSLTYDFIKGQPSFRCHAEEQVMTLKAGFDLTFQDALPSDLEVGDWVAETGFSPIPQIPYELHRLLEQRAVVKIMSGLKDKSGKEMAKEDYKEMLENLGFLVNPRVDGAVQKIVSRRGIAFYNRRGW